MTIQLDGGKFRHVIPCFQSGPYEEELRDHLRVLSENKIHLDSHTSRVKCYAEDPTKSLVLELEGKPDSVLSIHLEKPSKQVIRAKLADLVEDNVVTFTGVFTSESYIINRLISPAEYSATIRWHDRRQSAKADWYYVRVSQHNGQLAWSSPIWVGAA
jgi:hypothetical protein